MDVAVSDGYALGPQSKRDDPSGGLRRNGTQSSGPTVAFFDMRGPQVPQPYSR
jgi:hypothetical protein